MIRTRFLAIGLLPVGALAWIGGQMLPKQDAEVTSSQVPAVFKASTNMVQVPVVVRDRDGHAVGNLRAEDFQLFDQRKPQLISRFTVEQMQTRESLARANGFDPQSGGAAAGSLPARFLAYLADDLTVAPTDFPTGRSATLRHIDTLGPAERAAIFSTSGRVHLAFTGDHDLLRKTMTGINSLNRQQSWIEDTLRCRPMTFYRADLLVALDPGAMRDCVKPAPGNDPQAQGAEIAKQGEILMDAESVLMRSERDLKTYFVALDALIAKMATLPGDREILLLSPGMFVPSRFKQLQHEVIARAIRAKVIISGVDVRGVTVAYDSKHLEGTDPTTALDRYGLGETAERIGFMTDLAAGTGGTFLRGNNDLDLQLRRAASVPEYVYVLSFAPSDQRLDGKLHTLKVNLTNPRGFTVQARTSYYAADYSSDPVRQQIDDAFFSSQELKGLPVQLSTQFFKDGDNATLTVTAKVDANKLPFRKEDGRNRDNLTLVVGLFDQNGNYLSAYQKDIELRLKDETLARWLKSGIETATDFEVKPGKYLVRLVVRDSEGQSMAQQSTGVDIPW
jgi:VWFA-related protein